MRQQFDLSNVGYVKRIVIGQIEPGKLYTEAEANRDMQTLNRCLSDTPKGKIIGCEKHFALVNIGEHQVVQQWIVYHVGFSKPPYWEA